MFELFTDRARRVVVYAQDEATLLNHDNIGTEHFLLGLLRIDEFQRVARGLRRYGRHDDDCDPEGECSCGLDDLLREIPPEFDAE